MHFVGLVLITVSILIYLSRGYLGRIINSFRTNDVNGHEVSTSILPTENDCNYYDYKNLYLIYQLVRKVLLYVGIAILSIMLVQNSVWVQSFERTIRIFNIPMLVGYVFMLLSSVLEYVKFSNKVLNRVLFITLLLTGYLVYLLSLFISIRFW